MPRSPAIVLSIAGFDPSSGAGITADLKTIAAHGLFGISCITALTVQSSQGVAEVQPVSGEMVRKTLEVLLDDFQPAAVKIGMLGSRETAAAVTAVLEKASLPNIVLDPVLKSSSGAGLLDLEGIEFLKSSMLSLADVITPNLEETEVLSGIQVRGVTDMTIAARQLHRLGVRNVVITGGHLDQPTDLLSETGAEGRTLELPGEHVATSSTHGTGCAFATAIACNLALGKGLEQAVRLAKEYVSQGLKQAYPVGKGAGPINHLFRFPGKS